MNVPAVLVSDIPQDAVIVDVREQEEWDAGRAPGAIHLPMGELAGRLDELPDAPLHVICRSGGRSARVTAYLNANGWDAVNVEGGMQSWAAAGRPMTCASGAPEVL